MLNLPIGELVGSVQRLSGLCQTITLRPINNPNDQLRFDLEGWDSNIKAADELVRTSKIIGLMVTHKIAVMIAQILRNAPLIEGMRVIDRNLYPSLLSSLSTIAQVLSTEAETRVAIVISPDKVELYEPKEPIFDAGISAKFNSAIFDMNEAAKCLALGRATAAVFHLMHVVEIAIRAVHACLGLTPPTNPSWGIWLKEIREERVRRGVNTWPLNDYFQDVYSSLDAIKDAYRDPTLHVQTIHTEEEAGLIFNYTKGLMKKIALRMDENGEPKV